jgi:putative transposase
MLREIGMRRANFLIAHELAGRGLKVDYHSVWDFVHAEKLSFKKKRGGWRTRSSRRGAAASPVDKVSRPRRS